MTTSLFQCCFSIQNIFSLLGNTFLCLMLIITSNHITYVFMIQINVNYGNTDQLLFYI